MATRYQLVCDECLFYRTFARLSTANQALFTHLSSRSHHIASGRRQTGFMRYDVKFCGHCMGDRPHTSLGVCLACAELEAS